MDFDLGNDEECGQERLFFFKELLKSSAVRIEVEQNFCFETAADDLCRAGLFESHEHGGTDLREPLPLFGGVFSDSTSERRSLGEERHVDALGFALGFREILPDFL